MALSINQRGTIPLTAVGSSTLSFTAKLQTAATSTLYPEGTVFDCSGYKTETITSTIVVRRAGITFLFGEGDFTMSAGGDMFDIQAPNVTIIGVSRSAKDSISANGSTRFIMTNVSGGFHITSTPSALVSWKSSDSLTVMNVDLIGVKSAYTASGGSVVYSVRGAGGIMINEGNPDASGSNLNNILINEVLIDGTRQHGIMIYGGMASKIQNTRVRNAGGHGFYIAGSTTSTNLDTCYASGCYLAGFSIHDTTYSTLNNCASDSNGLGYWMRNANAVTLSSCGAEACEVRSSIPSNLGIFLPSQAGNITINDIGSDHVNYIKGSSFLFTGGSNITGTSCYSKDPGNRAGETTFASKYTAHIHGEEGTDKANMDNFLATGTSPVKYKYRLKDVSNIHIDAYISTYDPINPEETPDGAMTPVADVLDQGSSNSFGDFTNLKSFTEMRTTIANPLENLRINQLEVENRLSIPVYNAHPANPQAGTIYFNTALNKLYMFSGSGWYDTCCATAPTPAPVCTFPDGSPQQIYISNYNAANGLGGYYRVGNRVYVIGEQMNASSFDPNTPQAIVSMFDLETESYQVIATRPEILSSLPTLANPLTYAALGSHIYSVSTNSLYIVGFMQGYDNPSGMNVNSIGSTSFIIKLNLTNNQIDAYYLLDNLSPAQAISNYNLLYQADLYIDNNQLVAIRKGHAGATEGATMTITTYDLDDLSLIDYVSGGANTPNGYGPIDIKVKERFAQYNTRSLLIPWYLETDSNGSGFYITNLTSGSSSKFYYDSTPVTQDTVFAVTITHSESGDTFFVADTYQQKVYEIEYDGLSVINTWNLGYVGQVSEKTINGKRILFYMKNTVGANAILRNWAAYNVTDDILLGTLPYGSSGGQVTSFPYNLWSTINGNPQDYMYALNGTTNIGKICAPYAV